MTTIITHDNDEHVSETTDLRVEPRELDLTYGETSVIWNASGDIAVAIASAHKTGAKGMPIGAQGGYVVVGLDVDGEQHEVTSSDEAGGRDHGQLLEDAIEILEVALRGVRQASGD